MRPRIAQERCAEVAHADVPDQPGPDQFLHRSPRFGQWNASEPHSRPISGGIVEPLGRIALLEGDERQRDREVDQVKIEIIHPEIAKRTFKGRANVLAGVVGVPELGCDPQFVCWHSHALESSADSFTHFHLVAVIASTIEMTVADANGLADEAGRRGLRASSKDRGQRAVSAASGEGEMSAHTVFQVGIG